MMRIVSECVAHGLLDCSLVPRALVGAPAFRQAAAAQVGANLRQGGRDLDPAIGQDEQGRRRIAQALAQPLLEAERLVADLHATARSLALEERAQLAP